MRVREVTWGGSPDWASGCSRRAGHEEGLTAIQEAVQKYRRLAEANPAAYEPDLTKSRTVGAHQPQLRPGCDELMEAPRRHCPG